jgi:hypothetical protein
MSYCWVYVVCTLCLSLSNQNALGATYGFLLSVVFFFFAFLLDYRNLKCKCAFLCGLIVQKIVRLGTLKRV